MFTATVTLNGKTHDRQIQNQTIFDISDSDSENDNNTGNSNFSTAENSFHEENEEVGGGDSDVSGGPDGWSDVNEENVSEEVVREMGDSNCNVKRGFRGRAFKLGDDGKIHIAVRQLYRNMRHFRQIIFYYSVQEGFILKRIKNKRKRITCSCRVEGCPWRVRGSSTKDRITFMLKTFRDEHNCLVVTKNRDVRALWLGRKFKGIIQENPDINIRVLHSIVLRTYGLDVPDHTLYRAKKFALNIGDA
ncbi:hypothetical protein JRO89_XS02G0074000 [Xanthoceras sorbifolium]|uniref:Transposase MuDR plant domain-containing protein n=1 Tax=Xanthoceras sorbifolium TaxID=99658 RepID=A0ABQ8IFE0_9ROSI|nr:hypothetical protein JRO89_XS02G0074000 [Xanthoceras sorbifolium]